MILKDSDISQYDVCTIARTNRILNRLTTPRLYTRINVRAWNTLLFLRPELCDHVRVLECCLDSIPTSIQYDKALVLAKACMVPSRAQALGLTYDLLQQCYLGNGAAQARLILHLLPSTLRELHVRTKSVTPIYPGRP
jgi:hypothetical protein